MEILCQITNVSTINSRCFLLPHVQVTLLWEEQTQHHLLASARLYFLPEDTPKGRTREHGEVGQRSRGRLLIIVLHTGPLCFFLCWLSYNFLASDWSWRPPPPHGVHWHWHGSTFTQQVTVLLDIEFKVTVGGGFDSVILKCVFDTDWLLNVK